LPVVFNGCGTWYLPLRVFEYRVLKGIFEPKREEIRGSCRKLHNEQLHNLYSSISMTRAMKPRKMRWEGM
jgi:hypothetical protein